MDHNFIPRIIGKGGDTIRALREKYDAPLHQLKVIIGHSYVDQWLDSVVVYGGIYPIASMYGIFIYIYHTNQLNVGKYTSPMDGMGMVKNFSGKSFLAFCYHFTCHVSG